MSQNSPPMHAAPPAEGLPGVAPGSLSPTGAARKAVMLGELQTALRARRRRRTAGRAALIAAVPALALGAALRLLPRDDSRDDLDRSPTLVVDHAPHPAAAASTDGTATDPAVPAALAATIQVRPASPVAARIQLIQTDPTALARLTIAPPERSMIRIIDDHELIASLAETGRSVGIIRTGGRLMLVSNEPGPDPLPGFESDGPDADWGG